MINIGLVSSDNSFNLYYRLFVGSSMSQRVYSWIGTNPDETETGIKNNQTTQNKIPAS